MVYSTPDDVRKLCGFTTAEAPDSDLNYYISKANSHIMRDVTVRRKNAILLAGKNEYEWFTQNWPIADINGDSQVTSSDVQVFLYKDRTDVSSKEPLTVSSVDWLIGRIVLAKKPSDYEVIVADYSFYPNEIDWTVLKDAEAYYAGFMFAIKKWVHIPEWMKLGTVTTRQAVKPYLHLYNEYKRCMTQLKTRKWKRGKFKEIIEPFRKRIDALAVTEEEELVFPG